MNPNYAPPVALTEGGRKLPCGAGGADEAPGASLIIRTEKITRTYTMGGAVVTALRAADLTVRTGEFIALMGASGSGKSTLLNVIGLLDRPTSGEYWLEETPVSSLRRDELADLRGLRIGFIFQNFNLLPRLSAWENVALPLAYRNGQFRHQDQFTRAREALSRVGLDHRANHQPMELSGGERQRVAIARALVTQPAVILADEPTGNLDSNTGTEIMQLLKELNDEGRTIVMVTHDLNVAHYAGQIYSMRDGFLSEAKNHVAQ
ncbi:MAG TPA: ABC transporter ATP-binding protein [Anaerolineales bacterium]|nr:ABC transporter ATP-binding protein [Anaerolineales bacterium]